MSFSVLGHLSILTANVQLAYGSNFSTPFLFTSKSDLISSQFYFFLLPVNILSNLMYWLNFNQEKLCFNIARTHFIWHGYPSVLNPWMIHTIHTHTHTHTFLRSFHVNILQITQCYSIKIDDKLILKSVLVYFIIP